MTYSCCGCCVVEEEPDRCAFNGDRNSHVSPCDECERDEYAKWEAAQPPLRRSDAPR